MRRATTTTTTTAKETKKRVQRDLLRRHVVEAAERTFATRGFAGTRMQDIADAAGLALATLYTIVDGKEDLYAEIHRTRGRALFEAAASATKGAGSAWAALLQAMRAYAEFLLRHPDYLTLHLQESQPWALTPRFATDEQMTLWREGLDLTVAMFKAAIAEGAVVDESPELLARLMIADHQVFLGEWELNGRKEPPESLLARMLAHAERAFAARPHAPRRKK
jgi:AcrR family transcriptional regulator